MARKVTDPLTYRTARDRYNTLRHKGRVKLALNTWLFPVGTDPADADSYGILFHGTVILQFHRDGGVTYHTGGHRTAVTLERLNRYGPCGVWKATTCWHVTTPEGVSVVYHDGFVYAPPPTLARDWLTADVVALTTTPDTPNPILADALADAGCGREDFLARLRSDNPAVARLARAAVTLAVANLSA